MTEIFDEGKTSTHAVSFFDEEDAPVIPESIEYRIMASATVEVITWTPIEAGEIAATITIEIPATSNTIGTIGRKRFLTVRATHGGGKVITKELAYLLNDLKGI